MHMLKQNIQTLKGFRDFLPEQKRQRDFVAKKIKETFELFGFEPIETPTLEYADLLLGKYGEEADRLVYTFEDKGGRKIGLKYDQTVPTARLLAQYQNELPKYLRRYQMQNVFRAEKPQKGRFREFAQCDIDIFGTKNEIADAEILACTYFAYKNIGFESVKILINSRMVLQDTLQSYVNEKVGINSIIQTVDKFDKKTEEEVLAELETKGVSDPKGAIMAIKSATPDRNLEKIFSILRKYNIPDETMEFNPLIARGLDYYTGMIFEVKIPQYGGGSVGGGGRYDNLINDLSGVDIPAVGMAFGFDRTTEAALELGLINVSPAPVRVLVTIFSDEYLGNSLSVLSHLRENGVAAEIYPEAENISKQIKYADKKKIPYVVIIGEQEASQNKITLKDLTSGNNRLIEIQELYEMLQ